MRGAQRDLAEVLARQAALVRDDDELLDSLAADHSPDDANALAALPRPLAAPGRAPLARTAASVVGHGRRGARGGPRRSAGGRAPRRPAGRASRSAVAPRHRRRDRRRDAADDVDLPGPGALRCARDRGVGRGGPPVAWPDGRRCAVVDADRAGAVGHRPDGARRASASGPWAGGGSKLVRDALVDAGVPAARRASARSCRPAPDAAVPDDSALWVVGYRIDDRVRVTSRTRRYLWMSADPC